MLRSMSRLRYCSMVSMILRFRSLRTIVVPG